MKLVSIIVPVYNVAPYLHECIDSIVNQTYSNLEIILVDDGSTDESGQICDAYAAQDHRIHVIHQTNGGVSAARNAGIAVATGEYIGFVDSDDFLDINMYSLLVSHLEANELDILECNAYRYKSKHNIKAYKNDGHIIIYNHDEALQIAMYDGFTAAWNKLYKRSVLGDIRFPTGRKFEDSATSYLIINNAQRVGHIDLCLYYYRLNPNSITQTSFDAKSRWDFILGYIERLEFATTHQLSYMSDCNSLLMKACLSCLTAYYAKPSDVNRQYYEQCVDLIRQYRNKDSYSQLSSKYKLFLYVFDRFDVIHKIGATCSYMAKKIQSL